MPHQTAIHAAPRGTCTALACVCVRWSGTLRMLDETLGDPCFELGLEHRAELTAARERLVRDLAGVHAAKEEGRCEAHSPSRWRAAGL